MTKYRRFTLPVTVILLLGAAFGGCVADNSTEQHELALLAGLLGPNSELARRAESIIGGAEVGRTEENRMGTARFTYSFKEDGNTYQNTCSSTVLTNRVILTAKHCVRRGSTVKVDGTWTWGSGLTSEMTQSARVRLRGEGRNLWERLKNTQSLRIARIIEKSGSSGSDDVALLVLEEPFKMAGSTEKYYRRIVTDRNSTLNGKTVTCYGWGNNTVTGGSGTLRKAGMRIDSSTPSLVHFDNSCNCEKITHSGDSGGSCFYSDRIASIASFGQLNSGNTFKQKSWHVGPESFRRWAVENASRKVYVRVDGMARYRRIEMQLYADKLEDGGTRTSRNWLRVFDKRFHFRRRVMADSTYRAVITKQPRSHSCTISNPTGKVTSPGGSLTIYVNCKRT